MSVTLTAETPGTTVTGICTDAAGNSSPVATSVVRIDRTAPELTASCRPLLHTPGVGGVDALSGVDSVSMTGSTMTGSTMVRRDDDDLRQQQSFTVLDKAGNSVIAIFGVKADDDATQFSLRSLSYNGATAIPPEANPLRCESDADENSSAMTGAHLPDLTQHMRLPGQALAAEAHFHAEQNQTEIVVIRRGIVERTVRPGLVFLNLTTQGGALGFNF